VATVALANTGATPLSGLGLQLLDGSKHVYATSLTLAPGAFTTLTATWKASGGSHAVQAVADPQNLVAESDETDNSATFTVGAQG